MERSGDRNAGRYHTATHALNRKYELSDTQNVTDDGYSIPRWMMIVGIWTIPATIAVLQSTVGYAYGGVLKREWMWALFQFPRWMLWALVTPFALSAVERWPLQSGTWVRNGSRHLIHAILIAVILDVLWLPAGLTLERFISPDAYTMFSGGRRVSNSNIGLIFILRLPATVFGRTVLGGAFTYAAIIAFAQSMRYQRNLREREIQQVALESQLAQAQVQALKMQVHPHFLFNTLHAVTVLIREEPDAAIRTVTRLGDLLRVTLSRATRAEVPLSDELEVLRYFLEIEQTRHHDRLTVTYDIQPEALDALLPDLLLQPLVENAIRHGIEKRAGSGTIDIEARVTGPWLNIAITDNGVGITTDSLTEGVGLTTTRERLSRLYGEQHELVITNTSDKGCSVRVRLPFRRSQS